MEPVTNKTQSFKLWSDGGLGNRLRVWRTVGAWFASNFQGRVSLRYLGETGEGLYAYEVARKDVPFVLGHWRSEGAVLARVVVNESAPDEALVLQGEFLNDVVLPDTVEAFCFSTVKLSMRDALKLERREVKGLTGRLLLKQVMTPSSWSDFDVLLERYPGHVLEVSVYGRCLGDLPGRNALVWEARHY